MNFTSSIIHILSRVDRQANVGLLVQELNAKVMPGFIPEWEKQRDTRSIRGSCVSHLLSYEHFASDDTPHLVVEDDATILQAGLMSLRWLDKLPDDCGILLVGAETPNVTIGEDGFHEVAVPFHGAHGVLYNSPVLSKTHFLLFAYKALAMNKMSDDGACYEGLLDVALKQSGLKMYRLNQMAFSTMETLSDRTGTILPARNHNPILA